MMSSVIKTKFGYTLDSDNPHDEPCPLCGSGVCHVEEHPLWVFCTNPSCDFHDFLSRDYLLVERIKYLLKYPPLFLRMNPLCNQRFSNVKLPFVNEEDAHAGRYIIREFQLDYEKYTCNYQAKGGQKKFCYKADSPIVAQYSSLIKMVRDGWLWEEHPDLEEFIGKKFKSDL